MWREPRSYHVFPTYINVTHVGNVPSQNERHPLMYIMLHKSSQHLPLRMMQQAKDPLFMMMWYFC